MKRDLKKCKAYWSIYNKRPGYAGFFLGGMASVFDVGGVLRSPYNDTIASRSNTNAVKSYFDATCSYLKNARERLIHDSSEVKK